MTYRADIDGLRALAILLVTIFHFDLFSIGKAGFIGVDVFFVISGFLITSIIVQSLSAGTFTIKDFLYRRVRRLYPALLATLTLYLGAGFFLLIPDVFSELALEALLSQLYVVNFYFWRSVNYFGLQADSVPLLHMWSLAVEEQFYLFFPIACLIVWRWKPQALPAAIAIAAVASFLLGYFLTPIKPWASFYLLPTRAWELLAGSLLALALRHKSPSGPVAMALGFIGLFVIGLALVIHTPATGVPGTFALLPVLAALCLIAGGMHAIAPVSRFLSLRPLVWIGLISYPLYLVHWPVMILIKESVFAFSLPWRVFGFVVSFVLAWMIYRFVETPIRHRRMLKIPSRFLGATVGLSAVLTLGSLGIWHSGGLPQRFDPKVSEFLSYAQEPPSQFHMCQDQFARRPMVPCVVGAPDVAPDMLVFGDSHAGAFAPAVSDWLARQGRVAFFSFSHGCLPVQNMGVAKCAAQARGALEFVDQTPGIETVMLMSIWRQPYEAGMLYRGVWASGAPLREAFDDELEAMVLALRALDKRVVIVEPFFGARGHVPKTLAKNAAFGRDWPLDKPLQEHTAEFRYFFAALDRAAQVGAERISLIEDLCTGGMCRALYDGRPVLSDSNHLSGGMSGVISTVLEREMNNLEE